MPMAYTERTGRTRKSPKKRSDKIADRGIMVLNIDNLLLKSLGYFAISALNPNIEVEKFTIRSNACAFFLFRYLG
jgi:hypothetical protein